LADAPLGAEEETQVFPINHPFAWIQNSIQAMVFPGKQSDSSPSSPSPAPSSDSQVVKTEQLSWDDFARSFGDDETKTDQKSIDTRHGVSLFDICGQADVEDVEEEKKFKWDNGSASPFLEAAMRSSASSPASDSDEEQHASSLASPASSTNFALPASEPVQSKKRKRAKESNPEAEQKKADLERIKQAVLDDYFNHGITSPAVLNKKHPGTNPTNIGRWLDKADPKRVEQRQPKPRKKSKKSLIVTLRLKKKERPQAALEPTPNQFNVFDMDMNRLDKQQQLNYEQVSTAFPDETPVRPKKKFRLLVSK